MKWFKSTAPAEIEKEVKDVIKTDKIEGTVPKVVTVVSELRKKKAELETTVADMLVEAAADQKKIDELEAILASLLNDGGGSVGDVV